MIKFLCATAMLFFMYGSLFAQNLTKKCVPASFAHEKSRTRESLSDDFGNFFEFKSVQYGTNQLGEGYVGVDAEHVMLTTIRFRDHKGKIVALRSDELALSRAIAYGSKSDQFVVCVLSPFSGIGSSGRFQNLVGLIAVQKPHGQSSLRAEGAIIRANSR